MKILVFYTDTEIVSVEEKEINEVVFIMSSEYFIHGQLDDVLQFFMNKGFDVTKINKLNNEN